MWEQRWLGGKQVDLGGRCAAYGLERRVSTEGGSADHDSALT